MTSEKPVGNVDQVPKGQAYSKAVRKVFKKFGKRKRPYYLGEPLEYMEQLLVTQHEKEVTTLKAKLRDKDKERPKCHFCGGELDHDSYCIKCLRPLRIEVQNRNKQISELKADLKMVEEDNEMLKKSCYNWKAENDKIGMIASFRNRKTAYEKGK